LLRADLNYAVVKFTLPECEKQIIASQYQLYLPTDKQLLEELNKELNSFEEKKIKPNLILKLCVNTYIKNLKKRYFGIFHFCHG